MATYKKIVDVETVAEATESMNVLVEDAGSLKKVPMGNVGGENSSVTIIHPENSTYPQSGKFYLGHPGNDVTEVTFDFVNQAMENGIVYVSCETCFSPIVYVFPDDSNTRYGVFITGCQPTLETFTIGIIPS